MHSFYGNIKNNSRTSFIFDKIYHSRLEMEQAIGLQNEKGSTVKELGYPGDGVYHGRYVLVEYGLRWIPGKEDSLIENKEYTENRKKDEDVYKMSFDSTVWQKFWEGDVEKYIMVAELNAKAPILEAIPDAPAASNKYYSNGKQEELKITNFGGPKDNSPHFDLVRSTDLNYKLHIPQNWKIDNSTHFLYNQAGFNKRKRSISIGITVSAPDVQEIMTGEDDKIEYTIKEKLLSQKNEEEYKNSIQWLEETNGEERYPVHIETEDFGQNVITAKYEKTSEDGLEEVMVKSVQPDTKKLLVDLGQIGNMMSDIWDLMYPNDDYAPFDDPGTPKNERGYLKETQFNEYKDSAPLYIKDNKGNFTPVDDEPYNPRIQYYGPKMMIPFDDPDTPEKDENGMLTEGQFNKYKDRPLYIKDKKQGFVAVGENDSYDENIQYFGEVKITDNGLRDIFIGNDRDPENAEYPDTVGGIVQYLYKLIGLKKDNDFRDVPPWNSFYGVLNGGLEMLGKPDDVFGSEHFLPVSDYDGEVKIGDPDGFGSLQLSNYKYLSKSGYGPLYVKVIQDEYRPVPTDTADQDDGYISNDLYNNHEIYGPLYTDTIGTLATKYNKDSLYYYRLNPLFEKSKGYTQDEEDGREDKENGKKGKIELASRTEKGTNNIQYYRDLNSLWALFRELQKLRNFYKIDWLNDVSSSPSNISNRPKVIFGIDTEQQKWKNIFEDENQSPKTKAMEEQSTQTNIDSIYARWTSQSYIKQA